MIYPRIIFSILCLLFFMNSCVTPNEKADLVILNGNIYTVNKMKPFAEAMVVKDERIIAIGTNEEIQSFTEGAAKVIDAKGQFIMPGFIEGHGHFTGLGYSLLDLNFLTSKSWNEIVAMVEEKVKTLQPGEWIDGRGWHQEKWIESPGETTNGYPFHKKISDITPDNPVILRHASGHALFANAKAMEIAGISMDSGDPEGGRIVRNDEGEAIGVFEERAMSMISVAHQEYLNTLSEDDRTKKWYEAVRIAQEESLRKGVTSFQDAGAKYFECERFLEIAEKGEFDMRLWAMARHRVDELEGKVGDYKVINAGNHYYTCRAIKSEVDGALGSYGAWLLKSYDDKPNFVGQNTTQISDVVRIAEIANEAGMQLCVHAIGDRANQEVLDIFENHVEKGDDKRWRIEHAQHLHPEDIPRFGDNDIIASMQGVHCTSDSPFVVRRLGQKRSKEGAYAWRSLIDNGAVIANGTDAPVEDVDPIISFYASVTRKRADNKIDFFPMQKMSREEAIKSYTWNNAYAAFEEEDKGSLEIGKLGDLVILSKDLINCSDDEILETKVLYTIVGGKVKYNNQTL